MENQRRPNSIDEQRLRYISGGRCQNPQCHKPLIEQGTNISELAHIISHAEGGPADYENMIVLCRECHKIRASDASQSTLDQLREWKRISERKNNSSFARKFKTFKEFSQVVTPILKRNRDIYQSYRATGDINDADKYKMWQTFTPEIIANNTELEIIFENNQRLFPEKNQIIINKFIQHSREFVITRNDEAKKRISLFPKKLGAIFGLDEYVDEKLDGSTNFLNALQNLIRLLIQQDKFVSFKFCSEGYGDCIIYKGKEEVKTLNINNSPLLHQIFWNNYLYKPIKTKLNYGTLGYIVRILTQEGIDYSFPDPSNFTRIRLNNTRTVKLCFEYCLSYSDLLEVATEEGLEKGLIIVNAHGYNGSPISEDAYEYAKEIGITLMKHKRFLAYIYNDMK